MTAFQRQAAPRLLLWTAVLSFASAMTALAALKHRAFSTGRFDLGNMVQAVWSTAHGAPLEATSLHGEQFVRVGAHFDPILVALVPAWWLWPSPALLLTVQAAAAAAGALPLFALARRHLHSQWAALGVVVAYLLAPALQWQTLSEFHPVALATPLLLFAIRYLDEDRLAAFAVFAALAVLTKEHIGLVVAGLGIWYALSRRRWRAGAGIAVAGVATSVLALTLVIPHFSPAGESSFYGRYEAIGGDPGGVAEVALTEPQTIVRELTETRDAGFTARLVVPAATSVLAPLFLLGAIPELLLNLLSATRTQTSIHYHYGAATLAVVYAGAVLGAARAARWARVHVERVALVLVALAAGATYALGPLPIWSALPRGERLGANSFRVTEHDRVAARALELVPRRAVVSASNSLGAHLSERRRILSFPYLADATWVAVDETDPSYSDRRAPLLKATAIARLRRDPAWRLVFSDDGVLIFRRRH